MPEVILGIGDLYVTNKPGTILKTYSLGSCVAVAIYDKRSKTGGMAHIALSNSNINLKKSEKKPGYFADTGISFLLTSLKKFNPTPVYAELDVYLIGGAAVAKMEDFFKIGENNINSIKTLLGNYGISTFKEDCGKNISRTVTFNIDNNNIIISNHLLGTWEL